MLKKSRLNRYEQNFLIWTVSLNAVISVILLAYKRSIETKIFGKLNVLMRDFCYVHFEIKYWLMKTSRMIFN